MHGAHGQDHGHSSAARDDAGRQAGSHAKDNHPAAHETTKHEASKPAGESKADHHASVPAPKTPKTPSPVSKKGK
jgi:hypothetical protein